MTDVPPAVRSKALAVGAEQWLEALYEMAWAEYRIGDFERALGNMITLNSPFFQDEYFPESLTVKAIIYYENCRYTEARATLDDFSAVAADDWVTLSTWFIARFT